METRLHSKGLGVSAAGCLGQSWSPTLGGEGRESPGKGGNSLCHRSQFFKQLSNIGAFKQIKGGPTVCSKMQFIVFLSLQEVAEAGAKARFKKVLDNS